MRKFLLIGLITFCSPLIGTANYHLGKSVQLNASMPDNLLDRLLTNKNFQSFCNETSVLVGKLKQAKCKQLLQKVAKNAATEAEKMTLAKSLGYASFAEIQNTARKIFHFRNNILKIFPEIGTTKEGRLSFETAIHEQVHKSENTDKFLGKGLPECVVFLDSFLFFCNSSFNPDEEAYTYCLLSAMDMFALCIWSEG